MRVTSRCANHPSKEASQRCRSCRKWLCENCFQRYRGRIYCGRGCQLRAAFGSVLETAAATAARPVHGAWAIAVCSAASALLLTAIGLMIGQLLEVAGQPPAPTPPARPTPAITARVVGEGGAARLLIEGAPSSRVLISDGERPLRIVTIVDSGKVELPLTGDLAAAAALRIVSLAAGDHSVDLELPQPSPAAAATAVPSSAPGPAASERLASGSAAQQPAPASAPPVLQLVRDGGPLVALTFDGDSSANRTTELLDVLHRLDVKATLFVTGRFIERHPGIIRRAVLSGHEVGNHTYSHPHLTTYASDRRHRLHPDMSRERLQSELRRTEEAFRAATGRRLQPLWRAPFGEENRALRGWALEVGYLHVRWSSLDRASLDSRDWIADEHSKLYQTSSVIMERLLRFPELRGGIVLMHLSTDRPEPPWEELPAFVEELRERGLEPAPVTEILERSPTWRPWLRRAEERHRETLER